MTTYDTLIIGGGPGGYVAAIRASQLGQSVALVEKAQLGGVCLNWGCIPTKSLIRNAEIINLLNQGQTFGFRFDNLDIDYAVAQQRSRQVSEQLTKGIAYLMNKHQIDVINGVAQLKSPTTVAVDGSTYQAQNIIIATGARPRSIPNVAINGRTILTYREILTLTEAPSSLAIIGGGPIGLEFAYIFNSYGTAVTVIEMLPHILPAEDEAISQALATHLSQSGMTIKTDTRVARLDSANDRVTLTLSHQDETEQIQAAAVLVAIGIMPNSQGLGLEALGVQTNQAGFIQVNKAMQTSVPNIYAIGDVTGELPLAHVASAQGSIAAEAIAGQTPRPLAYQKLPRCTYTHPEVASVGLTETQAQAQGMTVKTGRFPFQANGKALGGNTPAGFVKIVADATYDEIVGVHMIGDHVTEMIAGPTGMIGLESTLAELAHTVHPHPTMSEVLMEAAHAALGQTIHL